MIWLAVGIGGAIGAMLRYAVSMLLPPVAGGFLWATLLVNGIGSLLAGFAIVLLGARAADDPWRGLLMVGLLGALTTYSTFAVDSLRLIDEGQGAMAVLNVGATLLSCLAGAGFGMWLARALG